MRYGMQQPTGREILKFSVTGAVALSASANALLRAGSPLSPRAWVTAKDRRFQQIGVSPWQPSAKNTTKVIGFEPSKRFQNILGFGAAFTDASCYLFNKMNAQDKQALLSDLFSPDGLGLSVARTCVGASDYSTKPYSFDDSPEPDPELKHFTIEHDREYILPTLRAARKLNPDLFLFSSPWSPPGWMKAGGSMLGGSMRKKYCAPYANYFVKFLQDYSSEGVKINAITIQNEFDTDPDVSKYVHGVAWHGYMGSPEAMTKVHDAFPSKNAYWTEGGPDITSPDYATDWSKWAHTFTGVLRNWSQCIVGWNLLLDEKGNPNIGPFPSVDLVTIDSKTAPLTHTRQYCPFA